MRYAALNNNPSNGQLRRLQQYIQSQAQPELQTGSSDVTTAAGLDLLARPGQPTRSATRSGCAWSTTVKLPHPDRRPHDDDRPGGDDADRAEPAAPAPCRLTRHNPSGTMPRSVHLVTLTEFDPIPRSNTVKMTQRRMARPEPRWAHGHTPGRADAGAPLRGGAAGIDLVFALGRYRNNLQTVDQAGHGPGRHRQHRQGDRRRRDRRSRASTSRCRSSPRSSRRARSATPALLAGKVVATRRPPRSAADARRLHRRRRRHRHADARPARGLALDRRGPRRHRRRSSPVTGSTSTPAAGRDQGGAVDRTC